MTVAELIARLQELPPDMPVWTVNPHGMDWENTPVADGDKYPFVDHTEGSPGRGVYL